MITIKEPHEALKLPENIKKFKYKDETYYVVNNSFAYSNECMESYPCQHVVILDGSHTCMDGVSIYGLCFENKWLIPGHFIDYRKRYEKRLNSDDD